MVSSLNNMLNEMKDAYMIEKESIMCGYYA